MVFCSRLTFVLLTLAGLAGCAVTGMPDDGFKPMKGQVGKDVMWLPTPQDMVDKLLPAPFGPTSPTREPGRRCAAVPSSRTRVEYCL